MKLLLLLILLVTIYISSISCFNVYNKNKVRVGTQECFTTNTIDLTSYATDFISFSFNANYIQSNGSIGQTTFFEQGAIDIDYTNQLMFVEYDVDNDDVVNFGKIWTFGQNNTQYFVSNIGNGDVCYSTTVEFPVSKPLEVVYKGDFSLGTIPMEVFEFQDNVKNITIQVLLVNKADCTITSTNSANTGEIDGYSIMNYYNYQSEPVEQLFQLPAVCANATPIPNLQQFKERLPKSLQNHL